MKAVFVPVLTVVALVVLSMTIAMADGEFDTDAGDSGNAVAEGRRLYRIYCSGCHGAQGRGDGPAADDLGPAPADLAVIQRNNDGVYPAAKLEKSISGLDSEPGHRSREMPLWGFAFRETGSDADQTKVVEEKIRKLVKYLESIQIDG
jgi:mono/diheme cytochrome c family protein